MSNRQVAVTKRLGRMRYVHRNNLQMSEDKSRRLLYRRVDEGTETAVGNKEFMGVNQEI